jgi:hypothetical protein
MSTETETGSNEPNEYGFAGDGTGPEPEPERKRADEVDGESIAVPAGDLTGSITGALEELTQKDDGDSDAS